MKLVVVFRTFFVLALAVLLCLPSVGDVAHVSGGRQASGASQPEDCDVALNGFENCGSPSNAPTSSCLAWHGASDFVGGTGFIKVGEVICTNQNELINGHPQSTMCTGGTVLLYSGVCVDENGYWPGMVVAPLPAP